MASTGRVCATMATGTPLATERFCAQRADLCTMFFVEEKEGGELDPLQLADVGAQQARVLTPLLSRPSAGLGMQILKPRVGNLVGN